MTIFTSWLKQFSPSGLHPPYQWDPCHALVHCPVKTIVVLCLSSSFIVLAGESVFLDPLLLSASLQHFLHFLVDNNPQFLWTSCYPICSLELKEWMLHWKLWLYHWLFSCLSLLFPTTHGKKWLHTVLIVCKLMHNLRMSLILGNSSVTHKSDGITTSMSLGCNLFTTQNITYPLVIFWWDCLLKHICHQSIFWLQHCFSSTICNAYSQQSVNF